MDGRGRLLNAAQPGLGTPPSQNITACISADSTVLNEGRLSCGRQRGPVVLIWALGFACNINLRIRALSVGVRTN